MAQVDPSIALGFKAPQIENSLTAMGRAQEVGVNALKMQEYQRGLQEENALRKLMSSGVDMNSPDAIRKMYEISPKLGMSYEKNRAEINKEKFGAQKLESEAVDSRLKLSRQMLDGVSTPDQYIAWHEANHRDPVLGPMLAARGVTEEQSRAKIARALAQPGGLQKLIAESKMGVEKFAEQNNISAYQGAQLALTKRGQDLAYNPDLQGQIETAKVIGKAKGEEAVAPIKDIQANVKALKSAGYDPVTGKDDVSSLIAKSTGSYAGAATDVAGRVVGYAPEGAKAIKTLETYASNMTTQLLGGKLGAGISNADRDFIVAGLGDIANPTVPTESRLAAWNAVKERMRVAGMLPEPKGATAAPTATKSGASVSNW